jgi:hypothetical protein
VPTFAYELNDDDAPQRFAPPGLVSAVATHASEMQYLFDLPNTHSGNAQGRPAGARSRHASGLGELRGR